jgi:ubiquinone/menaquinone biosynthesis C-methylase UbiE
MQSLKVKYSKLYAGLDKKPDSYRKMADNYEWAKREVGQHIDQYHYDEFNTEYLRRELENSRGKVVVECGCGPGGNLMPYIKRHQCIGFDFSKVALGKLRRHNSSIGLSLADISAIPLKAECVDYVVLARVLFVHEDVDFIVSILREVRRILKPNGRVLIVNDFSSVGVRMFNNLNDTMRRLISILRRDHSIYEFVLYYFSESDMRKMLSDAGLNLQNCELSNIHQGVYHLAYRNKVLGLLLRSNIRHYRIANRDHWERARLSNGKINKAYPLGFIGRVLVVFAKKYWPSLMALSLSCTAVKASSVERKTAEVVEKEEMLVGAL